MDTADKELISLLKENNEYLKQQNKLLIQISEILKGIYGGMP